jgi:hypothetical protein
VRDMDFLVSTAEHGTTTKLRGVTHGLLIKLDKLKGIQVSSDGQSVDLGAGLNIKETVDGLWQKAKKVTREYHSN